MQHIKDSGIDISYKDDLIPSNLAIKYLNELTQESDWHRPEIKFGDRVHHTNREVAWHADEGYVYYYSGQEHPWKDWTPTMKKIRSIVEDFMKMKFNGCLLNHYKNGSEYISPHSDDERDMIDGSPIVCVSLGATRDFVIKHLENGNRHVLPLEGGSLCIMRGDTQKVSKHSIPKRKAVKEPRISLTFRQCLRKIDPYQDLL